jgi:hypothetical protein
MSKMTNAEMIKKFELSLTYALKNGKPEKAIQIHPLGAKPTIEEIEYIKAHKAEIIAELEAEKARKEKEAESAKEARINDIKAGNIKIKLYYHDGEYLSGYTVHGEEAELLKELGLAKYVNGWGYYIENDKLVETLGKEFTYEQAAEFAKPAIDAKAAAKAEKEAKRQAIFGKAKETGKKQLLRQWSDECNDPNESCNVDTVYEWAMPDGTTKIERYHTW